MPVSLQKGQKVSLTKGNPGLKKVVVGLGWDVNAFDTGGAFDLDAAAFMLADNGRTTGSQDFVFYGNLTHPSGSVQHMGDNLTGEGDGDDEQIRVDLSLVPANITKIAFTVTIYDADVASVNFPVSSGIQHSMETVSLFLSFEAYAISLHGIHWMISPLIPMTKWLLACVSPDCASPSK